MTRVECDKDDCGYEWEYSGEMQMATCPSCQRKTLVNDDE